MGSLFITDTSPKAQNDIDHIIFTQQDNIMVSAEGEAVSSVNINDLEGHTVYHSEAPAETCTFSPDKSGIYIVHLSTHEHTYTKKVLVHKD
jgi:deoxycytidylate deaminase